MPLTRWAKMLMPVQSLAALITVTIVAARVSTSSRECDVMVARAVEALIFAAAVVVATVAMSFLIREAIVPASPTRALLRCRRSAYGLEPRDHVRLRRALASAYQRDCALALLAASAGLAAAGVLLVALR